MAIVESALRQPSPPPKRRRGGDGGKDDGESGVGVWGGCPGSGGGWWRLSGIITRSL